MSAADDLAAGVGDLARRRGLVVAVAESLTGGAVAQALARAPDAAEWFAGGAVTYRDDAKFRVLGVTPGPVVTVGCAAEMAAGVRDRFGADAAVALTGAGGPGPHEGVRAGTVYIATATAHGVRVDGHRYLGDPGEVVAAATEAALDALLEALRGLGTSDGRARAAGDREGARR